MGRKRSEVYVPGRVVGAQLDIPTADRFSDMAAALGTTQSAVLRELIHGWMREHADVIASQDAIPGTTAQLAS